MLINPDNLKARVDLAVFELALGNPEAADRHIAIALEQQPDFSKALFYKAMVYHQKNRIESAREILSELALQEDEYGQKAKDFLLEFSQKNTEKG